MTYEEIKSLYLRSEKPFSTRPYELNHFGRRNADLVTVNKWNDIRGVAYVDEFNVGHVLQWRATTKPGLSALNGKPMNANGTFILMPGFYRDCWKIGKHNKGNEHEHDALVQNGTGIFRGWRDNDMDGVFDFSGPIYTDVVGLNDHTTRAHTIKHVGGFSYGCQVTWDDKEHMMKMALCFRHAEVHLTEVFSYALFQD
jgi:hypothetical protein